MGAKGGYREGLVSGWLVVSEVGADSEVISKLWRFF